MPLSALRTSNQKAYNGQAVQIMSPKKFEDLSQPAVAVGAVARSAGSGQLGSASRSTDLKSNGSPSACPVSVRRRATRR